MRYSFESAFEVGDEVVMKAERLFDPDSDDPPTVYIVVGIVGDYGGGAPRVGVRIAGPDPHAPAAVVSEAELDYYEHESED